MRRTWLIAIAVFGLLVLGWYLTRSRDYSETAKGSPEYAAKWREAFAQISDPDEAKARYPEVQAKRFENGEWVVGVCRDSHRYRDGGTIVVKDSTGRVRAFFGHVCGTGSLGGNMMEPSKSLADFYGSSAWEQFEFREYPFP